MNKDRQLLPALLQRFQHVHARPNILPHEVVPGVAARAPLLERLLEAGDGTFHFFL